MSIQIGYCTNVHAGMGLDQSWANLRQHALEVKRRFSPDAPMGVGLWLSAATVEQLRGDRTGSGGASGRKGLAAENRLRQFAAWLADEGLVPFTLNGFPYGDFHQPIVKHRVYEPTWCDLQRLEYTLDLVEILDVLLPPGLDGSISTLPLMWGNPAPGDLQLQTAASNLHQVASRLETLERETGRFITLCLEPEPGCVLQTSRDVVDFFERHLLPDQDERVVRRYLRVCHDVCHAAVMFESQAEVFERYRSAGIGVGKVQVSSAVRARLDAVDPDQRAAALEQLRSFAEDRYLHQTVVASGGQSVAREERFFEDLPLVLADAAQGQWLDAEWRIHFHVPIYLERFGWLEATRDQIGECLLAARQTSDVTHFEVETYAWGVLPESLRQPSLAAGIADEMRWFREYAS